MKNMANNKIIIILIFVFIISISCRSNGNTVNPPVDTPNTEVFLTTDKAVYSPGETVKFKMDKSVTGDVKIRYRHLASTLDVMSVSSMEWNWTPPTSDYRGYMVDIYEISNGNEKIIGSIAVDVSSDWTRFPRYGFLSKYGEMQSSQIEAIVLNLKRHHINGVQFQDWHYKHHKPLSGTPANPSQNWIDIANRPVSFVTVKGYIDSLRKYNMKSMFYNLCFGALSDAQADGVNESWYIFKDQNHQNKDYHDLPNPYFWSDIFLTNPNNKDWQNYLIAQNNDLYSVFNFDGYQIDQLGNRGTVYDYNGDAVNLPVGYASFISVMKTARPEKRLVMNAVSQYGQEQIAKGNVDFLYTEVWGDQPKYTDLVSIINENNDYSNGKLKTVFAAYMNYNVANNKGYFNTPGILLTNAVMFAFGGSHLELGEHMLGKEYFPNDNLAMTAQLKSSLISYYDFLTAYQNLLRDGGNFNNPDISCTNGQISVANWPPQSGQVSVVGKVIDKKQVIHLINLSQANNFDWRDIDGRTPEPTMKSTIALQLRTAQAIEKIWFASPDISGGVAKEVTFTQNAASASFSLPSLKYWDMIVVEYK